MLYSRKVSIKSILFLFAHIYRPSLNPAGSAIEGRLKPSPTPPG